MMFMMKIIHDDGSKTNFKAGDVYSTAYPIGDNDWMIVIAPI